MKLVRAMDGVGVRDSVNVRIRFRVAVLRRGGALEYNQKDNTNTKDAPHIRIEDPEL